jgi:hypothetical protein
MSRTFSAPRVNREEASLDGKTPSFSQTRGTLSSYVKKNCPFQDHHNLKKETYETRRLTPNAFFSIHPPAKGTLLRINPTSMAKRKFQKSTKNSRKQTKGRTFSRHSSNPSNPNTGQLALLVEDCEQFITNPWFTAPRIIRQSTTVIYDEHLTGIGNTSRAMTNSGKFSQTHPSLLTKKPKTYRKQSYGPNYPKPNNLPFKKTLVS